MPVRVRAWLPVGEMERLSVALGVELGDGLRVGERVAVLLLDGAADPLLVTVPDRLGVIVRVGVPLLLAVLVGVDAGLRVAVALAVEVSLEDTVWLPVAEGEVLSVAVWLVVCDSVSFGEAESVAVPLGVIERVTSWLCVRDEDCDSVTDRVRACEGLCVALTVGVGACVLLGV